MKKTFTSKEFALMSLVQDTVDDIRCLVTDEKLDSIKLGFYLRDLMAHTESKLLNIVDNEDQPDKRNEAQEP